MCDGRHHIRIAPNAVGTFSTPNPSPEVIEALKECIAAAVKYEAARESDRSGILPTKEEDTAESAVLVIRHSPKEPTSE